MYLLDFNASTDENTVEEGEEENFSLSFRTPKRSQSPKHIKLKLPMSTLAGKISFLLLLSSWQSQRHFRGHPYKIESKSIPALFDGRGVSGGWAGQFPTHVLAKSHPKFLHKGSPNVRWAH